jgi:hypothetical protein
MVSRKILLCAPEPYCMKAQNKIARLRTMRSGVLPLTLWELVARDNERKVRKVLRQS